MKSNRYFLVIFFLMMAILPETRGQTALPKKCYMHLNGNIDKTMQIEMNLVRINDTLYGNYTFLTEPKDPKLRGGNFIPVGGKVKPDGSFILKEIPGQEGAVFKGKFENAQILKGIWENEKGDINLPFDLAEKYPEGIIPLSLSYQKASTPLVKKPKSPVATIEIALLVPAESSNSIVSDTVKKIILGKFEERLVKSQNPNPDMILNSMKQVYFENYISTNEAIYNKTQGVSFNWESIKLMDIIYNSSWYLCFSIDHYAFTGGAHGMENKDFIVINTRTGKIIDLTDIFTVDSGEELMHLLTNKIKEKYKILLSARLMENGFFTDEIKPNSNFYITSKGIGFHYNPYEFAPYSFGSTDIFLSYGEISQFIRSDSFVKGIIR